LLASNPTPTNLPESHTARPALPESIKAAINEHTAEIVQEAVEKEPVEIS